MILSHAGRLVASAMMGIAMLAAFNGIAAPAPPATVPPGALWVKTLAGVTSVARDAQGNVFVAGHYAGTQNFDGITLVTVSNRVNGYLAKYDSLGHLMWIREASPAYPTPPGVGTFPNAVQTDGDGNIYLAGSFNAGQISFGLGVSNLAVNQGINNQGDKRFDLFNVKYNPAGEPQWVRRGGGTNEDVSTGFAVNAIGLNFQTGTYSAVSDTWTIIGGTTYVNATPEPDTFLVKQNTFGQVLVSVPNGLTNSAGGSVAGDGLGNAYLTGSQFITASNLWQPFLLRRESGGALFWRLNLPAAASVAALSTGDAIIAGTYTNSIRLGNTTLNSAGATDVFIARVSTAGTVSWAKSAGGASAESFGEVRVNSANDVLVSGGFSGTATFGSSNLVSAGGRDVFLARYDSAGNLRWARRAGGASDDEASPLAVLGVEDTVIAGNFSGSVTFDGQIALESGGFTNFIARLVPTNPPGALQITTAPANTTVLLASPAQFAVGINSTTLVGYQWWKDGVPLPDGTNHQLSFSGAAREDAGNYHVIITNAAFALTSAPVTLSVLSPPLIVSQPQSVTAAVGDNATFVINAIGTAPLSYLWYDPYSGTIFQDSTNSILTLTNIQYGIRTNIVCRVGNPYGTAGSQLAYLYLLTPPQILTAPTNWAPNAGANGYFWATVDGTAPMSVQWFHDGTLIPGAVTTSLVMTNVQAADNGTYSLVVTNEWGQASAAATLTVTDIRPVLTSQPQNRSVGGGSSTSFAVSATGTTPMSFQWSRDGMPLSGATNRILSLPFVTLDDAGLYQAVVTNVMGATNSSTVRLSVFIHPDLLWVKTGGGARNDAATAVTLGPDARPYTAGFLASNALFGATNVIAPNNTNQIFLTAYDTAGTLLTVESWTGPQSDQANAIAVDASSNRIVAGQFRGTLDFGVTNLTSAGSNDAFVAKLAPDGTTLWARRFGGARDDIARGVALTSAGEIIVTGYFQGTNSFETTNLISSPVTSNDLFLVRFSPAGDLLWARKDGGTRDDRGHAVAVDGAGNAYVTGSFNGTATFGPTSLVASNQQSDAFLAKYDPAGNPLWALQVVGNGRDSGLGVAADPLGFVWLTGEFGRDFYGSMRLIKYDPAGTELWRVAVVISCCTGDYIRGTAVAVDGEGRSYVVGNTTAATTIAGATLGLGGYAAAFDTNGAALWARRIGREPSSVAVDAQTNVYVTGVFTNTFNFGSGVISNVTSRGSNDVFLAKLALVPTQLTEPLADQFLPMDSTLGLRASAVSSGGLLYQWQFNGADIAGATNAALTFTNALASAGSYTLVLRSALGTITNGPIAVSAFRFNWETNRSMFEVAGPLGANYRIEHCDLPDTNWSTLTNLTIATNPETAADSSISTATNRIYRLVREP